MLHFAYVIVYVFLVVGQPPKLLDMVGDIKGPYPDKDSCEVRMAELMTDIQNHKEEIYSMTGFTGDQLTIKGVCFSFPKGETSF